MLNDTTTVRLANAKEVLDAVEHLLAEAEQMDGHWLDAYESELVAFMLARKRLERALQQLQTDGE